MITNEARSKMGISFSSLRGFEELIVIKCCAFMNPLLALVRFPPQCSCVFNFVKDFVATIYYGQLSLLWTFAWPGIVLLSKLTTVLLSITRYTENSTCPFLSCRCNKIMSIENMRCTPSFLKLAYDVATSITAGPE